MKHDGIKGIIESGQAPCLVGLKKGPNSRYQPCFERPRPREDILHTARIIEDGGKMTPEMAAQIKKKLDAIDSQPPPQPVDYGKEGHPALDD